MIFAVLCRISSSENSCFCHARIHGRYMEM